MPISMIPVRYLIAGVAALIAAAVGINWLATRPATAANEGTSLDVAINAMVDGMDSFLPPGYQDTVCTGLPELTNSDDPVNSRLYGSNDAEATAMRAFLGTVGQHGADAAGVITEDQLQRVVLGEAGVEAYCASR